MYQSRHARDRRGKAPYNSQPTARPRPRTEPTRRLTRARVQRRDEFQPKVIRSNHDVEAWDTVFGKGSGLQPVRDTGLALQTRHEMRLEARRKRQRTLSLVAALAFFILLFAGIAWMQHSETTGRRLAEKATAQASVTEKTSSSRVKNASAKSQSGGTPNIASSSLTTATAVALTRESREESVTTTMRTPLVAEYKNIPIHLPVSTATLTEVAFHQASYTYSLSLDTHLPFLDLSKARKQKGTKRDWSMQPYGKKVLLCGKAIKVWRTGRRTSATSAVDCGAEAGSLVYAPIDGVVTRVNTYNYENKCTDYEIHIQPTGHKNLEMVIIHVESPYVVVGDKVVGGQTPIARVRKMSLFVRNQLASYTKGAGNHAHIQLNDTSKKSYLARQKTLKCKDETVEEMKKVGVKPEVIAAIKASIQKPKP